MYIDIQWPLALFSLCAGIGGALVAFAALAELASRAKDARFEAAVISLVLMVVGGLASMLHLASPQNAMAAAANLMSFSGISLELIMLGVTFVLAGIFALLVKRADGTALKVVAALCLISGLVLAYVCGHGYVIDARHMWNTELLPLAYMGSVLPVGAFAYLGLERRHAADGADLTVAKYAALVSVIVSVVTLVAYLVFLGPAIVNENALLTYGGIGLCGIIVPATAAVVVLRAASPGAVLPWAIAGAVASAVGALCLRVLMWVASEGYLDMFAMATTLMLGGQ